jgi:hypothetical protein
LYVEIGIIAWGSMRVIAVWLGRSVRAIKVMPDPWYKLPTWHVSSPLTAAGPLAPGFGMDM